MQLASKKYRDRYGLYLIEGNNLVHEAVRHGVEIEAVFIKEGYEAGTLSGLTGPYVLGEKLYRNIEQTETSQGIVAIVKRTEYSEADFFKECGTGNIVLLDRLQDPGNIGTIIRTAEAAGYKGLIALKGTGDIYSPKTVRAAAGSLFRLPVLFVDTPEQALNLIKAAGKKTICACTDAEVHYYDAELSENSALLVGNEGKGLCEYFTKNAEMRVKIPMDANVDSLNAGVAAGILMYECARNKFTMRKGEKS